ncbi:hypothetical protein ACNKHQ_17795 [Shigella flexneri]
MEGHLLAPMLEDVPPEDPFVALLVSGGHTQLISVTPGIGEYPASASRLTTRPVKPFHKTAKLLALDYPGGPMLSKLAAQGTEGRFVSPSNDRPSGPSNLSFSRLKTFAANTIRNNETDENRFRYRPSFEDAVAIR